MCYFDLKLYSKETLNQLFLNSFSSFGVFSFFLYKMFLYEKSQWFLYDCDLFLEHHHNRFLAFQSWFFCMLVILATTWLIAETTWLVLLFRLFSLASGAENPSLPLSQDSPSAVTFHHSYCCFNNPVQCRSGNFVLHCSETTLNWSSMYSVYFWVCFEFIGTETGDGPHKKQK